MFDSFGRRLGASGGRYLVSDAVVEGGVAVWTVGSVGGGLGGGEDGRGCEGGGGGAGEVGEGFVREVVEVGVEGLVGACYIEGRLWSREDEAWGIHGATVVV